MDRSKDRVCCFLLYTTGWISYAKKDVSVPVVWWANPAAECETGCHCTQSVTRPAERPRERVPSRLELDVVRTSPHQMTQLLTRCSSVLNLLRRRQQLRLIVQKERGEKKKNAVLLTKARRTRVATYGALDDYCLYENGLCLKTKCASQDSIG